MFQNLHIVSPVADANTRFTPARGWEFAANMGAVSITSTEADKLAAEYTLVFSPVAPIGPVALLGVDGTNRYVTPEGNWAAREIPARMRIYPFASTASDRQLQVLRAAGAPHFQGSEGQALFDSDGAESPLLRQIRQFLGLTHVGLDQAVRLTGQLLAAGLLIDAKIDVAMPGGASRSFGGFKAVDEARLAALDEATRATLTASGALGLLEAHRRSLGNIRRLLPPAAPAAEVAAEVAVAEKPAAVKKPRKPRKKPEA